MATTILVSCDECGKQYKVPGDLAGKKIRCKGCGEVIQVTGGSGGKAAAAAAKPKPKAAPARAPAVEEEDERNPNPYGVTNIDLAPRCPHCAHEMESHEAIICLNCGYNTRTRAKGVTKKTVEHSFGDWFLWLLPGILCVLVFLGMIGIDLFYCLVFPDMLEEGLLKDILTFGGIKLWIVIMSMFFMFFSAKFAIKRLILHPRPPEKEYD